MSRLALANLIIGFGIIFIAASAGSFIGLEVTKNFVANLSDSWSLVLQRSSHGHTNLFGYLHILFGLTLAYSRLSERFKKFQTIALCSGTIAMGPGMLARSLSSPSLELDLISIVVATGLSLALIAIGLHIYGLTLRFLERA